MGYDGTLRFDTKVDGTGFQSGLSSLKSLGKIAGGAVVAGLGAAVKVGAQFEAQMSAVGAISGASAKDLQILTNKAKEMGIKTKYSATEAGKAMEYMAMAGWKTEQMASGIEGIMNLAAASGEDLAATSDIVTDALTAFGMQAEQSGHFADILATASSNANTNVGMMGETFKYVAPLAGSMGYSAEDCAIAIGIMANSGIKGSQAGTTLRSTLSRLASPTKDVAAQMTKLGISITDQSGKIKPLRTLIGDMRKSFAGLSAAEKTAAASSIAGKNAMSGFLALMNTSDDDINKLTEAIDNCNGSTKEMAEKRMDNLAGKFTLLKSSAEGLGIAVYDGLSEPLKQGVSKAIESVNELTNSISNGPLKSDIANIGAAVGTVISGIASALPTVISGISGLINIISGFSGVITSVVAGVVAYKVAMTAANVVTGIFSALMAANPVGLAVAGIAAATTGIILLADAIKDSQTAYMAFGKELDTVSEKYQQQAQAQDELAQKSAALKSINEQLASGQFMAGSQEENDLLSQKKELEQWFIDNYGDYITAEEQKNGIRDETIAKIQDEVAALTEKQRLELENQTLKERTTVRQTGDEIAELTATNKGLEDQKGKLLDVNNAILKAQNAWAASNGTTEESNVILAELNSKLKEIDPNTTKFFDGWQKVDNALRDNENDISALNDTIDENNKTIQTGKDSLNSYQSAAQNLINIALGDTLEGWSQKYSLVQQAQQQLATSGNLTQDMVNQLNTAFPELAGSFDSADSASTTLASEMSSLESAMETARSKAQELGTDLKGIPTTVNCHINITADPIPSEVKTYLRGKGYATGTSGAPEGLAWVNDGNGPELIQGKDGSMRMYSGKNVLTHLNSGDRVYTAEQTKRMLRGIPHYANGIGNKYQGTVSITAWLDKVPEAFEHALDELKYKRDLDVIDEAEYYKELEALRDQHLQKGSDEWWKYEKEIYQYQKETAEKAAKDSFDALERELDLQFITEDEYYNKLAELRAQYYDEGSKEYQDYTDKIYKYNQKQEAERVDNEKAALKRRLDNGYISEKEYLQSIANLRDKYFKSGTDKWKDYTDEITDYYDSKVSSISSALKGTAQAWKDTSLTIIGGLNGLNDTKLTKDGWMFSNDLTLGGVGLNDYLTELADVYNWDEILSKVKARGADDSIMEELLGMSVEDAKKYGQALLDATDEEFQTHMTNRAALNALNESMAEKWGKALTQYFDESDIPDTFLDAGESSAEAFGEGLNAQVDNVLASFNDKISAGLNGMIASIGSGVGYSTTNNNYSYTISASGSTITEQLAAIDRKQEFDRLRGV